MRFDGKCGWLQTVVHVFGTVAFPYVAYITFTDADKYRHNMPEWFFYVLCGCIVLFNLAILFNWLTYFRSYTELGDTTLMLYSGFIRRTYDYNNIKEVRPSNCLFRFLGFNVYGIFYKKGNKRDFIFSVRI